MITVEEDCRTKAGTAHASPRGSDTFHAFVSPHGKCCLSFRDQVCKVIFGYFVIQVYGVPKDGINMLQLFETHDSLSTSEHQKNRADPFPHPSTTYWLNLSVFKIL